MLGAVRNQTTRHLGLAFAALGAAVFIAPGAAVAQSSSSTAQISVLTDRLSRLERDLRDVQDELYGGSNTRRPSAGRITGVAQPSQEVPSADIAVRITQIERELQSLTGQIEELNFRTQQNAMAIEALQVAIGAAPSGGVASSSRGPQSLIGDAPDRPSAPAAAVTVTLPDDPERAYPYAYDFILRNDYDRAAAAFEQFIERFPRDPKTPDARYRLGEIYLATKAYASAAEVFLAFIQEHPDHPRAPEGYLKLGQALVFLDNTDQACRVFTSLLSQYPDALPVVRERARGEQQKIGC